MRGSTVLVRIASIIRPPLSSSVHLFATSPTTSSVQVKSTAWFSSMRFLIRPICMRMMLESTSSDSG